ncbi:MAG: hypothetical protein ACTSVV_18890 [Promethearchaeota archaeon]
METKEIEIKLRPMEILRIKNVIRGSALEKNINVKFGDEIEGGSAIPCSTSTGNINLKILIKNEENKSHIIEEFISWIKNNWK